MSAPDPLFAARVKLDVQRRLFGGEARPLRVGRFELLHRIGAGGMSFVYAARDPELGRTVALKLLQERAGGERLLREARALARLRHPNVVSVYEVGSFEGHLFMAMEHVEGLTLGAWLDAAPRPWREVIRVLSGAGAGLVAAHELGLVHRDIKPDNLLVDASGQARVVDFGLVTDADRESPERFAPAGAEAGEALTLPGATPGTPLYMAPERFRGEPATPASDQYSFAVTLHEALFGALPFGGAELGAIREAVLARDPPAPPAIRGVPARVRRAVHRALARRPEARFPSLRALLDALEPPPSSRLRGALAGALILGALGALGATMKRSEASHAASCVEAGTCADPAEADAGDEPALYRELVLGSPSAEARAAMRAGLRALRDGDRGMELFGQAAERDPFYGAPHLWQAVLHSHGDLISARAAFEKAFARRAGMSPESRAFLTALVPCIQADPPDALACEARLAEAAQKSPGNAHLWFELARHRWNREGSSQAVIDAFDRALAADPGFVLPRFAKGQAFAYLGRFDEALATVEECLRAVPGATPCLHDRIWINAEQNRCKEVEADARRWQAAAPSDFFPYIYLASAAFGRGDSVEAIAELLRQSRALAPEAQRAFFTARDGALLALMRGDFDEALRGADAVEASVAHLPDQASRLIAPRLRMMIALETGARAEAGRVAEETLHTKEAWTLDPRVEDFAIARDFTPLLLDVLRDTGRITQGGRAELREVWLGQWKARTSRAHAPFLWLAAYAHGVDDEEEAREALSALPGYGRPPFHPLAYPDAGLGRMYLLTGHPDEALPFLRRAAEGCHGVEFTFGIELPWEALRASLDLGRALEQRGDPGGACQAYQRVLARWGRARRSVSAEQARSRYAALACPPPRSP